MFNRPSLDHAPQTTSRAFTLIEVLLVVTIMAILTVSGFQGIVNIQRSARVNDMYNRFVSFLDLARSYSLNGRQVTLADKTQKVPKSFGVGIVNISPGDKTCPASKQKIVQFFFEDETSNTISASNTLDSYCLHPQVTFQTSDPKPTHFLYSTPFGEFSYSGINLKNPTPLTAQFCDGNDCAAEPPPLTKSVTLYSNVGVPE